ncbi:POZ domain-containing protein [Coprinopsis marcescibilis]|uniref:Elongin-C n=1 Tax=Coprinopsis marcescibilis TaxID=230819 RepID=A0A5C3KLY6_COPMA|nr:POZ domain-containing protein [Coprinopsis marcescibilis]
MSDIEMQPESENPANEWVRIDSNDGFSYLVKRNVAETSGTMRNMLDPNSGYAEAQTRTCLIDERGIVTEKLIEYMCFKAHYQTVGPKEDIPSQEMQERIPPEIVLEVLLAADYQEM